MSTAVPSKRLLRPHTPPPGRGLAGVLILLFTAFHIAHYTLGTISTAQVTINGETKTVSYLELREEPSDPKSHPDVYAMTWAGFHHPVIATLYILAQLVLITHLSH